MGDIANKSFKLVDTDDNRYLHSNLLDLAARHNLKLNKE